MNVNLTVIAKSVRLVAFNFFERGLKYVFVCFFVFAILSPEIIFCGHDGHVFHLPINSVLFLKLERIY